MSTRFFAVGVGNSLLAQSEGGYASEAEARQYAEERVNDNQPIRLLKVEFLGTVEIRLTRERVWT